MKKNYYFAALGLLVASCASDEIVDTATGYKPATDTPISFVTSQKNITRATKFQEAGHYNFGVFGYKSTDKVHNIMANYLVGYYDDAKAYSTAGTTVGDKEELVDGKSYWMYEGLGYNEFTGTFAGQRLNAGEQYASNIDKQYLRYWDMAADYTYFYAYAPYVNTVYTGNEVTYVDGQKVSTSTDTYVMTIPYGTLKHGYDKEDEFEFMYASKKVAKADYGHDVALEFKRLNAKVNIKFWEDIPGYDVRIIDLTNDYSVSAVPAINDGNSNKYGYKLGQIYTKNGAKIQFADGVMTGMKQYAGETSSEPLNFKAPSAAKIGDNRLDATLSPTTYFAIPKGSSAGVLSNGAVDFTDAGTLNTDLDDTGLTFHVSYELISTTGEVITVKDATVFVPTTYTNWKENTHYTYIFKITTNSNGSTDSADTPNPTDPEVPTELGLYPIIFDNCTVQDWDTMESEHIISEGTSLAYHDVQLSDYSVTSGSPATITVTVTNEDKFAGAAIDYTKVAVTGPDATVDTWYNNAGTITIPSTAAAGVYTVTYTCNPGTLQYNNHPTTWTEKFYVENAYTISTNLPAVGTNALAATALRISATMDGNTVTPAAAELSIEYPDNVDKTKVKVSSDGTKIEVAQDATPGKYKLVYTITVDGSKVKVAEKVFDVVDYQPALTHSVVYLEGSPVVVKLGRTGGDESMWVDDDCSGKITCGASGSDMTITVANDTPEGVRTVYYVVNQSDADSKSMYQCMFNVQNTYAVSLSKTTLNTNLGAENMSPIGTDFIKITSKKNGVADVLSAATALMYKVQTSAGVDLNTSDYTISYVAATSTEDACIKLQVRNDVDAGNYKVVYTGQTTPDTKTAEATFTIQK